MIIASSDLRPAADPAASGLAHPERFVVGHPFNPVYLMPLVEICGGDRDRAETKSAPPRSTARIGMRPLHVRKEIDGFIADRLMEALWREALWLVADDVATAEEIDDAMRFGPGLRWAFMGTFLIYRMAGGEAGMRHFMAQFGPALKLPWTKLIDVPELDDALLDKIVAQSDEQAAGARSASWSGSATIAWWRCSAGCAARNSARAKTSPTSSGGGSRRPARSGAGGGGDRRTRCNTK